MLAGLACPSGAGPASPQGCRLRGQLAGLAGHVRNRPVPGRSCLAGRQGTLGNADRVAAGLNGLLITGDMVLGGLPVVGEVALAATGIYLAGDFLYQHWTPFHDVANDVGHATVRAADDVGQAADSAWHKVTSFENTLTSVGSLF
jgi:hypothetical protein